MKNYSKTKIYRIAGRDFPCISVYYNKSNYLFINLIDQEITKNLKNKNYTSWVEKNMN